MPSKKKKYNARFPAGRIKKIMQTDEEIGKVAQAVPIVISRTLELFVESLLKKVMQITSAKNAKTLTPTHMKQCILSESRFDFLKDLVKGIPDVSSSEDDFGTPSENISPVTPLSAKAYSGYSCFQFHQSSDSSSSKSSGATSHPPIPQTSQPKFYREIPIGSEDCESESCENSAPSGTCGTSVIQHTSSLLSNHCIPVLTNTKEANPSLLKTIFGRKKVQLKVPNCFKTDDNKTADESKEEEDDSVELEENGYHREGNISKTCTIDEDYDV